MKKETNGLQLQLKKQAESKRHPFWLDALCLALLNCGGALILTNVCPSVTFPWWGCALTTTVLGLGLLVLYTQRFGGWVLPAGILALLLFCLPLYRYVLEGQYVLANDVQGKIVARTGRILLDFAPADAKNLPWKLRAFYSI